MSRFGSHLYVVRPHHCLHSSTINSCSYVYSTFKRKVTNGVFSTRSCDDLLKLSYHPFTPDPYSRYSFIYSFPSNNCVYTQTMGRNNLVSYQIKFSQNRNKRALFSMSSWCGYDRSESCSIGKVNDHLLTWEEFTKQKVSQQLSNQFPTSNPLLANDVYFNDKDAESSDKKQTKESTDRNGFDILKSNLNDPLSNCKDFIKPVNFGQLLSSDIWKTSKPELKDSSTAKKNLRKSSGMTGWPKPPLPASGKPNLKLPDHKVQSIPIYKSFNNMRESKVMKNKTDLPKHNENQGRVGDFFESTKSQPVVTTPQKINVPEQGVRKEAVQLASSGEPGPDIKKISISEPKYLKHESTLEISEPLKTGDGKVNICSLSHSHVQDDGLKPKIQESLPDDSYKPTKVLPACQPALVTAKSERVTVVTTRPTIPQPMFDHNVTENKHLSPKNKNPDGTIDLAEPIVSNIKKATMCEKCIVDEKKTRQNQETRRIIYSTDPVANLSEKIEELVTTSTNRTVKNIYKMEPANSSREERKTSKQATRKVTTVDYDSAKSIDSSLDRSLFTKYISRKSGNKKCYSLSKKVASSEHSLKPLEKNIHSGSLEKKVLSSEGIDFHSHSKYSPKESLVGQEKKMNQINDVQRKESSTFTGANDQWNVDSDRDPISPALSKKATTISPNLDPDISKYVILLKSAKDLFADKNEVTVHNNLIKEQVPQKRSILDIFNSINKSAVIIQKDFYINEKISQKIREAEKKENKITPEKIKLGKEGCEGFDTICDEKDETDEVVSILHHDHFDSFDPDAKVSSKPEHSSHDNANHLETKISNSDSLPRNPITAAIYKNSNSVASDQSKSSDLKLRSHRWAEVSSYNSQKEGENDSIDTVESQEKIVPSNSLKPITTELHKNSNSSKSKPSNLNIRSSKLSEVQPNNAETENHESSVTPHRQENVKTSNILKPLAAVIKNSNTVTSGQRKPSNLNLRSSRFAEVQSNKVEETKNDESGVTPRSQENVMTSNTLKPIAAVGKNSNSINSSQSKPSNLNFRSSGLPEIPSNKDEEVKLVESGVTSPTHKKTVMRNSLDHSDSNSSKSSVTQNKFKNKLFLRAGSKINFNRHRDTRKKEAESSIINLKPYKKIEQSDSTPPVETRSVLNKTSVDENKEESPEVLAPHSSWNFIDEGKSKHEISNNAGDSDHLYFNYGTSLKGPQKNKEVSSGWDMFLNDLDLHKSKSTSSETTPKGEFDYKSDFNSGYNESLMSKDGSSDVLSSSNSAGSNYLPVLRSFHSDNPTPPPVEPPSSGSGVTKKTVIDVSSSNGKTNIKITESKQYPSGRTQPPLLVQSFFQVTGGSEMFRDYESIVNSIKSKIDYAEKTIPIEKKLTGIYNENSLKSEPKQSSSTPDTLSFDAVDFNTKDIRSVVNKLNSNRSENSDNDINYVGVVKSQNEEQFPIKRQSLTKLNNQMETPVIKLQIKLINAKELGELIKERQASSIKEDKETKAVVQAESEPTYEESIDKMRKKFIGSTLNSSPNLTPKAKRNIKKKKVYLRPVSLVESNELKKNHGKKKLRPHTRDDQKPTPRGSPYFADFDQSEVTSYEIKNNEQAKPPVKLTNKQFSKDKPESAPITLNPRDLLKERKDPKLTEMTRIGDLIDKYILENYEELSQHKLSITSFPEKSPSQPPPSQKALINNSRENFISAEKIVLFPLTNKKKDLGYVKPKEGIINIDLLSNPYLRDKYASLPSVSKVLNETMADSSKLALEKWKNNMIKEMGEQKFSEYYSNQLNKGKEFHKAIKEHVMGKELRSFQKDVALCFQSVEWVLKDVTDVTAVESCVVHPVLGYKGIFDCVGKYRNKPVLIEWKLSNRVKSGIKSTYDAPVQLSAYLGALNYDKNYHFQLQGGLIVVAYADGSPADLFQMPMEGCERFWTLWLNRLSTYLTAMQPKIAL